MVSPMREKRTWPPKEKDADSAESAAFEATVAVVKETVVRSGEVLVSAKEDLSDHKRWLEAQRAAVLADRARHERWLQKQKEKQEALERRERARQRRRLMRQNAMRAVEDAAFAVLDFFLSLFWRSVWRIRTLFAALRDAILRGLAWIGARFRALGALIARLAASAASAIAAKARTTAAALGRRVSAAGLSLAAKSGELARTAGTAVGAAGSALAATSAELTRSTGGILTAARSSVAATSSGIAEAVGLHPGLMRSPAPDVPTEGGGEQETALDQPARAAGQPAASEGAQILLFPASDRASAVPAPSALAPESEPPSGSAEPHSSGGSEHSVAGAGLAARFAPAAAAAAAMVRDSAERLARLVLAISATVAPLTRAASAKASAAASAVSAKVRETAPHLHEAIGRGAGAVAIYAKTAASRAGALLAPIKPSPGGAENEVSSATGMLALPAGVRARGYELSHMLIISGLVLLVCGGLLLGSGLLLRAGGGVGSVASSVASLVEKPPSLHSIEWFFDEPELPIAERSVFTAELTPQGVRLTGLAIKAENNSDEALSVLEGVVKPDAKRGELKLAVKVDMTPDAHGAEAADAPADGAVPAHAFFSLVVPFPPEAHGEEPGIALDDFIAAYGGLMLKLRYEAGGTQKSLIQYLSPEMLKAQLTEIQHEAKGS